MPRNPYIQCLAFTVSLLFGISLSPATEPPVDYSTQIKPLLAERCFACHGPLKQESSLRLDAGLFILEGGDSGEIVIPGHADDSLLIEMVASTDAPPLMPPEGEGSPFKAEQVELLKRWIDEGAKFPHDDQPEIDPRDFWSYQPIIRPDVPTHVSDNLNPIDAFVDSRLTEKRLNSSPTSRSAYFIARRLLSRPLRVCLPPLQISRLS